MQNDEKKVIDNFWDKHEDDIKIVNVYAADNTYIGDMLIDPSFVTGTNSFTCEFSNRKMTLKAVS